jgi:DNA-binding winged helix-turn-helix (wHTH) protein
MQRHDRRTKPRQIARRHRPSRWAAMKTNTHPEPTRWRQNLLPHGANGSTSARADVALEFGRSRVLLRRRQLLADGVPIELGTRAFDLLLVLLQADGSLVTKEELLSRVWPGIVVSEENLKVQVSALRKALGTDRDVIRTEFGRGYRFTGVLRSNAAADPCQSSTRVRLHSGRTLFPQNFRCPVSLQFEVAIRR